MARGFGTKGRISRSPHTRKPRDANADKLRKLRGEEYGTAVTQPRAFDAAVNIAAAQKKKGKPKGGPL